ncbi:MAG: PKD domain-containing protein, partial [Haloarculaceae archaeon]
MTHSRSTLLGLTLAMVMVLGMAMTGTTAATDADGPITVSQGGDCYAPGTIGDGTENVSTFYNYSVENDYSSEGTTHLQENQVSNLFLYNGSEGKSLVFLHDKYKQAPYGSTITFVITGLPEAGEWAVEDDGYPGRDDNWDISATRTEVDWKWSPDRTDGGAYRGLGAEENISIEIDPAFNEDAEAWGDWTWSGDQDNRTEEWRLLDSNGDKVTQFDMDQNVTVNVGPCDQTSPTASLSVNNTNPTVGESVAFDASNSTDNEGITEYRWDFDGDGTVDDTTSSATIKHAYASA